MSKRRYAPARPSGDGTISPRMDRKDQSDAGRRYVFASPDVDRRDGIPGEVTTDWVRCGKPGCRCMTGGKPHGPYHSHRWREETYEERDGVLVLAGRCQRRRYVPRHDAARVAALCEKHRDRRYTLRRAIETLSPRGQERRLRQAIKMLSEEYGWGAGNG